MTYNVRVGVMAPTVADKIVFGFCIAFAIAFVLYLVWLLRMSHERYEGDARLAGGRVVTALSRVGRVAGLLAVVACVLGGLGGAVAFGVMAWRLIPNHVLAFLPILLMVPLFLWGLTQAE